MGLLTTLTTAETDYLRSQRLARLATVDGTNAPHVVPVGFELSGERDAIVVIGYKLTSSLKWRNLQANPSVAIVIDDLETVDPWKPRGIQLRGTAELIDAPGHEAIVIHPRTVASWGIDTHAYQRSTRTIE